MTRTTRYRLLIAAIAISVVMVLFSLVTGREGSQQSVTPTVKPDAAVTAPAIVESASPEDAPSTEPRDSVVSYGTSVEFVDGLLVKVKKPYINNTTLEGWSDFWITLKAGPDGWSGEAEGMTVIQYVTPAKDESAQTECFNVSDPTDVPFVESLSANRSKTYSCQQPTTELGGTVFLTTAGTLVAEWK